MFVLSQGRMTLMVVADALREISALQSQRNIPSLHLEADDVLKAT